MLSILHPDDIMPSYSFINKVILGPLNVNQNKLVDREYRVKCKTIYGETKTYSIGIYLDKLGRKRGYFSR